MTPSEPDSASVQPRENFQPSWRALCATVTAVAATYLYFLIFAQFGFLKTVQAVVGQEGALLRPLMAVMGGGGIAGSIGVARIFSEQRGRPLMFTGFGLGALAAGLSMIANGPVGLFLCAALTGVGTGIVTVALAALLRREVGGKKLGGCLGAGTGLAYGLSNLPLLFNAGATGQAVIGMVACGVGGFAVLGFAQRAPKHDAGGFDYRPGSIGAWVTVFFVLVGLDSAAFYVIQHTPALKAGTWGGDAQLYLNAIVHAAAALLAGVMLDRRWIAFTALTAAGLLVVACDLLGRGPGALSTAAFFYAAGVSCYSTMLVFYPARSGRPGIGALVYAVAGWGGSALGIGMAKNLSVVPGWFPSVAGVVVLGALLGRRQMSRKEI